MKKAKFRSRVSQLEQRQTRRSKKPRQEPVDVEGCHEVMQLLWDCWGKQFPAESLERFRSVWGDDLFETIEEGMQVFGRAIAEGSALPVCWPPLPDRPSVDASEPAAIAPAIAEASPEPAAATQPAAAVPAAVPRPTASPVPAPAAQPASPAPFPQRRLIPQLWSQ